MLIAVFTFLAGILGAALVAYGAWLIAAPAGFMAAGFFFLVFSYLAARNAAPTLSEQPGREDE